MPKSRVLTEQSLLRRLRGSSGSKLSTQGRKSGSVKKQARAPKVKLHRSGYPELLEPPVRQIPWWVLPEDQQRILTPGGGGLGGLIGGLLKPGGGGGGPGHDPGHDPGHGPEHDPGHGPEHGPGHGPGPGPGPHPHPPGPGPVPPPPPPPHPPHPPGPPGPFPPPPPRPPVPIPIPIPIPIPGPVPVPIPTPGQAYVIVQIDGGASFPGVTQSAYAYYYPGITIRQALQSTGLVTFGPNGYIAAVSGIRIGGNIGVSLRYNGRAVPQTLLDIAADPYSTIGLALYTL
ncbi:hypothetical protein [Cohnella fermenti]|uniref:Uncharacterized protein n=1 Tax=Cohnella fermenti TaxID=2565925 RepID=A0A4S4BIW9_9BACL|nr:hypothetical protein [Cohnella fermenti]THF73981.1 hypothetical protein E6C55_26745 [Cohnella fermenti]